MYLAHVLLSTYLPRHSGSTTVPQGVGGSVFAMYLAHVPLAATTLWKYHSTTGGVGGSVFAMYLAHILLSAYLPRHSGSTTVPQGGWGVVYLFCILR